MTTYTLRSCAAEHPQAGERFDAHQALAIVERMHRDAAMPPELVLHVIACEADFLHLPAVAALAASILERWPQAVHQVVSLGCLGLYAAIQQVQQLKPRSACIYVYEIPGDQMQRHFDALGIGCEGDGMQAEEGLACLSLVRSDADVALPGDLQILDCRILAKEGSVSGTRRMLAELESSLAEQLPGLDHWVMFDVPSHWSRMLRRWFDGKFGGRFDAASERVRMIASSEQGRGHRLSYKPAAELALHRTQVAPGQRLGIGSVGIGGRFAWLAVRAVSSDEVWRMPSPEVHRPSARGMPRGQGSVALGTHPVFELPQQPGLRCVDEQYLGASDTYFVWPLTRTPVAVPLSTEPIPTPIHEDLVAP